MTYKISKNSQLQFAFENSEEDLNALLLPQKFNEWFANKSWQLRDHQRVLLEKSIARKSCLLIAPTGAGKTLAGFLPSLIDLAENPIDRKSKFHGLHTLYVSPLKALAVDVDRNLSTPINEMELPIQTETRSGDTPSSKKQRQRRNPPDILMTTPEQLALLLSHKDSERLFKELKNLIIDELHALVTSKRGDLLSLGLARLKTLAPDMRMIGLSATVAKPQELAVFIADQKDNAAEIVNAGPGPQPDIQLLELKERVPWSGHSAKFAFQEIYQQIKIHKTVLIFVNTRSQAEVVFQGLWKINEDALPIALHHGSLDVSQRRKVETAMVKGTLRAVVCTSTLDLGIDWGDVDLVINIGAPKGSSRLLQRIGRANHRLNEPSKAFLVPANRFEVMECRAAQDVAIEGHQDSPAPRSGGLDVLAQHVLGMACADPFDPISLYDEIKTALPYRDLDWETFEEIIDFVATGGYALKAYDQYARIRKNNDGRYKITHPRVAQQYRMNVGTIVEAPMIKVRLARPRRTNSGKSLVGGGGKILGEIEEAFIEQLTPKDTFLFAGEILKFETMVENEAYVSKANDDSPKIPSYLGGKFPLSTYLADRVRQIISDPAQWSKLPGDVGKWLKIQQIRSIIPKRDQLLIETFPHGQRYYLVCYPFEGRLAHQTLGMLLTRRLERANARPQGFIASEYALAIWGVRDLNTMITMDRLDLAHLFDQDMLGDDLDVWIADSSLMKRTFRNCAVIAGLIEQQQLGNRKTARQMTVSSDLIYDVLREHQPDHVLMKAAWADASEGLLDLSRLGDMLGRIKGRIAHRALDRVSPLAVPVLLDIGKEIVPGDADDVLLAESAENLIMEAMRLD